MIKKILGLFIIGNSLIGITFGYTTINNCRNQATACNGTATTSRKCLEIENNEEFVIGNMTYKVDNNANVYSAVDGGDYYLTYRRFYNASSYYDKYNSYLYRGEDNYLHYIFSKASNGLNITYNSGGVCIVNSNNINTIAQKCGYSQKRFCGTDCRMPYTGNIEEFYQTNGNFDKIYFLPRRENSPSGNFCYVKGENAYCIASDFTDNYINICKYGTEETSDNYKFGTFNIETYSTNNFKLSPFGNNGGGGSNQITIRTGKNYYCPTFGQLLEMQPSNYNTGLCYNGTLKYENGQITTVQKQDIQTIFTDYQEYQQYIYLYNNYCTGPATQTTCENAFNGEREKYSIIANAINNNVDDKELWNYCNIRLNYDLNTTTCVASQSGYIAEKPTQQELIDYIENIGNIGEIITPTSGNILNSLIGSGDTREEIATRDLFGQLNQIKEKVSTIFNERNGVNGIIPDYILWLILTTLLLTVLFKK